MSTLWTSNLGVAAARRQPYVVINDCRALELRTITPLVRSHLVELYRAHHDQLSECLLAEAWIRDSLFARGLLKAVQWRYPPSWPSEVVSTWDDAERFCARAVARPAVRAAAQTVLG